MSKRAEEAALKTYPEEIGMFHEADIHYEADLNKAARIKYIEGYEQAEKDTIEQASEWWYQRIAPVFGNGLAKNIAEEFKQAMKEK